MDEIQSKTSLDASADRVNEKLVATAAEMTHKIAELEDRAATLEQTVEGWSMCYECMQ